MDAETNDVVECHCPDEVMMDNWYKYTAGRATVGKANTGLLTAASTRPGLLLDTSCVTVMTVFALKPLRTNKKAKCRLFLSTSPPGIRESNSSVRPTEPISPTVKVSQLH